jgi:putative DNA primase/helicase
MTFEAEILAQMQDHQLPDLPSGHPIFDGKYKRFGPGKKGWYILRKITLESGKEVVTGAFGINQGDNHNTVPVRIETEALSKEEVAEYAARQQEFKAAEEKKRVDAAHLAANRAKGQWASAGVDHVESHPYLVKKDVVAEGLRLAADGNLYIPLYRYSHDGAGLIGLQKITPEGGKLYNKGMDKIGASFLLGAAVDAPVIGIGEGYATCQSARMGALLQPEGRYDLPVMVAFDAGNIIHVARRLRADFPSAHLLFLADDDFLLSARYQERLLEDFKIEDAPPVDGEWRTITAGVDQAKVMAEWRADEQGVKFIFADIRCGRRLKEYQFKNAGVTACRAAAAEVGNASVVVPQFAARGDNKLTDFNDLQQAESINVVAVQIGAAIADALTPSPPEGEQVRPAGPHLALVPPPPGKEDQSGASAPEKQMQRKTQGRDMPEDWDDDAPAAAGEGEGDGNKSKGKAVKLRPPSFWKTVDDLLDDFVLLYGTDTAWDSASRIQIKVNNIRLAYGNDQVKFWLGNPDRKMIPHKNLVFDPTMTVDDKTHVNMFDGFTVEPVEGPCGKILGLLSHLCDGNQEIVNWILKWVAYPLQNPGAKMGSSIIMHGDEGSGKNLFWELVVRKVYGKHGSVIGNAQIEDKFNDWASQKLFFVCDEVVTNKEMRQHKGKLKGLITGQTIQINPKGLPGREEGNYNNFVFLSNELQPLALDKTDRRYLVLWTPPNQLEAWYLEILAEINSGGVAAFYHYLLNEVDCSDFGTHAKPPSTVAKDNLISLGLSPSERFFIQWSSGELTIPFITCSSMQLYSGFQRWCTLNGERYPPSETLFGRTVGRIGAKQLSKQIVKYDLGEDVRQRTVYMIGERKDGQSIQDFVAGASGLFEAQLRKYRHVYDQGSE